MEFWIGFWKFCLIAAMSLFFIMAIFVTVGGARDIRKPFQRLDEEQSTDEE